MSEPMKGKEIRFVAGKYAGKKGWINASEQANRYIPVIVSTGNGDKPTFVDRASIRFEENYKNPKCFAEAVIAACPDVETKLVCLCRTFAKCQIHKDPEGFSNVMRNELNDAIHRHRNLGARALYQDIPYECVKAKPGSRK